MYVRIGGVSKAVATAENFCKYSYFERLPSRKVYIHELVGHDGADMKTYSSISMNKTWADQAFLYTLQTACFDPASTGNIVASSLYAWEPKF